MQKIKKSKIYLTIIIGVIMGSCASNQSKQESKTTTPKTISPINIKTSPLQDASRIMQDYDAYQLAMTGLKQKQTSFAFSFLATQAGQNNAMVENVRIGLLKILGKNQDWSSFASQYKQLAKGSVNDEVNCYAALAGVSGESSSASLAKKIIKSNETLTEGCNKLIENAASRGMLSESDVWRRVRILFSANNLSLARSLAAAIGQPLSNTSDTSSKAYKINQITPIITPSGRNRADYDSFISNLSDQVDAEDVKFVNGMIGLSKARDLQTSSALYYFDQADQKQLSNQQWEWYARSALHQRQWAKLKQVITAMPSDLATTPTWLYWQGKAELALGQKNSADALLNKAAKSGRNFYAILATEELGIPLNVKSNSAAITNSEVKQVGQNGQVNRAIVLFQNSLATGDNRMRTAAQQQWRFASRDMSDAELIAASKLALSNQFYEMSIYSADKSDGILDYQLRFPSPDKSTVDHYASQYGIESAWVFGLIRQESRFMRVAKSSVGAAGLMQIMPGTARMIANKLGISANNIHDLDTNINMGVWYISDLYNQFYSVPLATSAYNAGPGRAKRWRQSGLDGAIYAETIPFNETRDYVKKVMSNTMYYSHLFGNSKKTLKSRLGKI